MVLVDTPVWSLALRRRAEDLSAQDRQMTQALVDLVMKSQVRLLGPIRQELLSGIREEAQYRRIRDHLRDFPDVDLDMGDYEEAANIANKCRRAGVANTPVDMLICSVALRHGWQVLTTDRDFVQYRRVVRVRLLKPQD